MGLPSSGVKWANRDIDLTKPGGFCETPFVYEKSFFSWGNIDGHNPSSVSAFAYNWGGVNQAEPWYDLLRQHTRQHADRQHRRW